MEIDKALTHLPTDHAYYQARNAFLNLYWTKSIGKPSYTPLVEEFSAWLAQQGAVITKHDDKQYLVTDSVGVSPGYDTLSFSDPAQATWFALRWS
jgi:hypothetical protein